MLRIGILALAAILALAGVNQLDDQSRKALPDISAPIPTRAACDQVDEARTPALEQQPDEIRIVSMEDSVFKPVEISVDAGKRFSIEVTNNGQFVHNIRIDGPDHGFDTMDDIVSPDIAPGGTCKTDAASLEAGRYRFRDDFNPKTMIGSLSVQ